MDNCKLPVLPSNMFWRIMECGDNHKLFLVKRTPSWVIGDKHEYLGNAWIHTTKDDYYTPIAIDEIKKQIEACAAIILSGFNAQQARKAALNSLIGDYPPQKLT